MLCLCLRGVVRKYSGWCLVGMSLLWQGCETQPSGDNSLKERVAVPQKNTTEKHVKWVPKKKSLPLRAGETTHFALLFTSLSAEALRIDSLSLTMGRHTLSCTSYLAGDTTFLATHLPADLPLGEQKFSLKLHVSNGQTEEHAKMFTVYSPSPPAAYTFVRQAVYPHNPDAYTQGLFYAAGYLFEGTGQKGKSSLRKVDKESAKVLQQHDLPADEFGEGITMYKDKIYQLTWQAHKGYIYEASSFQVTDSFTYSTEGWGITYWESPDKHEENDEKGYIVISDGTEYLHFYSPESMEKSHSVQVYTHEDKVVDLNELETVKEYIYANVYQEDYLVIINPSTGEVVGKLVLEDLYNFDYYDRKIDVLNGIAYNPQEDCFYVTGKWWPKLFEINILQKKN